MPCVLPIIAQVATAIPSLTDTTSPYQGFFPVSSRWTRTCAYRGTPNFTFGTRQILAAIERSVWRGQIQRLVFLRHIPARQGMALHAILDFLGSDGQCWPSIATIAARAGVHPDTVHEAKCTARRLGLLTWDNRHARVGSKVGQITNQYQFHVLGDAEYRLFSMKRNFRQKQALKVLPSVSPASEYAPRPYAPGSTAYSRWAERLARQGAREEEQGLPSRPPWLGPRPGFSPV